MVARLSRQLNDSLGTTSITVSHDIQECAEIVDYLYFRLPGRIVAHGTPAEMRGSSQPFVDQFVNGKPDGPIPFHYPATGYATELSLSTGAG